MERVKRTHAHLLANMKIHYSQPKGFVGRNICYLVKWNDDVYGSIVGGSSTQSLPGRDEFFGITREDKRKSNEALLQIVNNIFYHVEPHDDGYPTRNFTQKVLKLFRNVVAQDWEQKYGNKVIGFESLIEMPRTGETYRRDGWQEIGVTKGFTCRRTSGLQDGEKFTGRRVWDYENLRPKRVFVRHA